MEQILSYLQDPAWWFSAFFIAIIASIVAGFAKDKIDLWIGKISASYRERKSSKRLEREKLIATLSENEGFLIITMVRAVGLIVFQCTAIILFLLSPMWSELVSVWCTAVPNDPSCSEGDNKKHFAIVASATYGLIAVYVSYISSRFTRIAILGYRSYRKVRNLPFVK